MGEITKAPINSGMSEKSSLRKEGTKGTGISMYCKTTATAVSMAVMAILVILLLFLEDWFVMEKTSCFFVLSTKKARA